MQGTLTLFNLFSMVPVLSSAASIPFPFKTISLAISSICIKLSFNTFIPGNSFPSRDSKKAPPAVDKCENSFYFCFFIAAIVSPPPTIEINCLDLVFSDIDNANDLVPFKNFLFS